MTSEPSPADIRRIATEEAFLVPEQLDAYRAIGKSAWGDPDLDFWRHTEHPRVARLLPRLLDLGEGRLKDMDDNGVAVQLLLLNTPGVQIFDPATATALATVANDRLAEAIARHPTRFAGLGAFAPQDPAGAVKEIERAMTKLHLSGLVVNSHTGGEYLDQEKFWPILEAAEALGAALYIHPRIPPEAARGYRDHGLGGAVWGFMAEAGLHGMRLIASGALDRFPKLQVVLGHLGEGLPYWIARADRMAAALPGGPGGLKLKPSEYLQRNISITTSGMNFHAGIKFCIEVLGADRILFAVDYPYDDSAFAVAQMDGAPIGAADRAKIYHQNAERVFRLPAGAGIRRGTAAAA
ncbi:MAG TPA: amidohydrolase family protein [Hyphomicrobiales bacterium]|nr:amidohydrolase family protein [Hyphomicrobiales bacterium]